MASAAMNNTRKPVKIFLLTFELKLCLFQKVMQTFSYFTPMWTIYNI